MKTRICRATLSCNQSSSQEGTRTTVTRSVKSSSVIAGSAEDFFFELAEAYFGLRISQLLLD